MGGVAYPRPQRFIGVTQPALRVIDHADRRVAIGGDKHQAANRLRPGALILGQQRRARITQAQFDQDRRALGEDTAVRQLQGRDLFQRVEPRQLVGPGRRRPGRGFDDAVRHLATLQGDLDDGRAGALCPIKLIHDHPLA